MNWRDIPLEEYVNGETFEAACDVDTEKDPNWMASISKIASPVVSVFCQTHELKNRLGGLKHCGKKYVLVTHNSDGGINYWDTGRGFDHWWEKIECVPRWYCQNCDVTEPNVIPIPIALENSYVFTRDIKMKYMRNLVEKNIEKKDRIFLCFNPGTNLLQRESAYKYFNGLSWASIMQGQNNINLYRPFFDEMARCAFVLAPDGNGLDTVRLWEALYLGCIPVVKRHPFTEYFARHLPIMVVDYWSDVTIERLIAFKEKSKTMTYNFDMLVGSYWKKEIERAKAEICDLLLQLS